jgi:hypothetical protein
VAVARSVLTVNAAEVAAIAGDLRRSFSGVR